MSTQLDRSAVRVLRPKIPWVPDYFVVAGPEGCVRSPMSVAALYVAAERIARAEALARFGDAECFTLLYNARRTRRKAWPHVHVILAKSVWGKRAALLCLALKHVSRPRRWFGRGRAGGASSS